MSFGCLLVSPASFFSQGQVLLAQGKVQALQNCCPDGKLLPTHSLAGGLLALRGSLLFIFIVSRNALSFWRVYCLSRPPRMRMKKKKKDTLSFSSVPRDFRVTGNVTLGLGDIPGGFGETQNTSRGGYPRCSAETEEGESRGSSQGLRHPLQSHQGRGNRILPFPGPFLMERPRRPRKV